MLTESAVISPFRRFLFQVATTPTSEAIDFFIDSRALIFDRPELALAL